MYFYALRDSLHSKAVCCRHRIQKVCLHIDVFVGASVSHLEVKIFSCKHRIRKVCHVTFYVLLVCLELDISSCKYHIHKVLLLYLYVCFYVQLRCLAVQIASCKQHIHKVCPKYVYLGKYFMYAYYKVPKMARGRDSKCIYLYCITLHCHALHCISTALGYIRLHYTALACIRPH